MSTPSNKTISLFLVGALLLLAGITLVLAWWPDVVVLFRGGIGVLLALAGMFTLYSIKR